jgi:molecular chaperone HtpG
MKDYILYKNLKGEYVTAKEYLDSQNGKFKNTIFYISDETNQGHYINMFKVEGIDAVYMTETIDDAFISYIENDLNTKTASDDNADKDDEIKFRSIDSDIASIMKGENSDSEASSSIDKDALIEVFKENLSDEKLDIQVEGLKNPSISAMITVSEEKKRMNSMMRQYAVAMNTDMGLSDETGSLVLNSNNELIKYIANNKDSEDIKLLCQQIYDIACLAHAPLSADRMTSFISRNNDMLTRLIK